MRGWPRESDFFQKCFPECCSNESVCVCVYACMHVFMHVCMCLFHRCVCVCACVHACMSLCMCACICSTGVCVCVHSVGVWVCIVWVCVHSVGVWSDSSNTGVLMCVCVCVWSDSSNTGVLVCAESSLQVRLAPLQPEATAERRQVCYRGSVWNHYRYIRWYTPQNWGIIHNYVQQSPGSFADEDDILTVNLVIRP